MIEHAEDAITTARFAGVIESAELHSANLVTIVPSGDRGENTLIFNDGIWDSVYTGDPYDDLAIDARDVTDYVVAKDNTAQIEDDGDYLVPSGAFFVVTYNGAGEVPSPVVTPAPTSSPAATPTPAASATATPSPTVAMPTPAFSPTPSPPTPTPSGFDAFFAVAGLLIVTVHRIRTGGKNEKT
jgi:cell division septation protein DedD